MILKLVVIAIMAKIGNANNYSSYDSITVECNHTHMLISLTDASQTKGSMMLHNSKEPQCYTNNTENWIIAVQLNSTYCSGTVIKQDVSYKVLVRPSFLNQDKKYFYVMCKTGAFRGNVTVVSQTVKFTVKPDEGNFVKNQSGIGPTAKPPTVSMKFTYTNGTNIPNSAVILEKSKVIMLLTPDNDRYRIQPLKCTATGRSGDTLTLINRGCKGDYDYAIHFGDFNRVSGSEHEVNVSFNIFTFVDGIASLTFRCEIEVCDKNDSCDFKRCSSERKRRAATSLNGKRADANGQLLVSKDSSSSVGDDNNPFLDETVVVIIGSSAGALMLILVAMLIILARKNRRHNRVEQIKLIVDLEIAQTTPPKLGQKTQSSNMPD